MSKLVWNTLQIFLLATVMLIYLPRALAAPPDLRATYDETIRLLDAGQWQKAAQLCKEVIGSAKDQEMLYKTYGLLGEAYSNLNNPWEAAHAYKEAFRVAKQAGAQSYAAQYAHLAGNLYVAFDDPQEPLRYFQEALQLNQGKDAHLESWTWLRLGEAYERQGDWRQARTHFEKALQLHQAHKDKEGECYGLKNLGDYWLAIGEYDNALRFYNRAFDLVDDSSGALPNKEQLRYMIVSNLSLAYQRKGDYEHARQYAEQALHMGERRKDRQVLQEMAGRIGTIYLRMEKLADARQELRRALGLAAATGQKQWEGLWLSRLAEVWLREGQLENAWQYYHRAVTLGQKLGYRQIVREATLGLGAVWEARADAARRAGAAQEAEDDYRAAWDCYGDVIRMVEDEAEGMMLENELSGFLQDKIEPYERMVNLCLRRGDRAQAFDYAQRARTRALLRKLPESEFLRVLRRIDPAFAKADEQHQKEMQPIYDRLNAQLAELKRARKEGAGEAALRKLNTGIAELEEEKNRRERAWHERIPAYQNFYHAKRPGVPEIQGRLGAGEFAIIYHVQAKNTVAFLIGKRSFEVVRLPGFGRDRRRELLYTIEAVGGQRHEIDPENPLLGDAIYPALHTVYQQLFEPLAERLPPASRLVIVRDDALHHLPFEMLVVEERGADSTFLLGPYAISYADSPSLLDPGRARPVDASRAQYDLVAVADPDFGDRPGTYIERLHAWLFGPPGTPLDGRQKWGFLPYTASEVRGILPFFNRARVLRWKEATEAAFRREATQARIVHIATHHAADEDNDWNACLVFAQGPWVAQQGQDGYAHAWEIAGLDMAALMVVLSACESGKGTLKTAEGNLGMPRAFLYAGVPSVVMTLWPVRDDITARLQKKFYYYLMAGGLDKREALRKAKLDLIKAGWTHPSLWAAFVLDGDTTEIRSKVQAQSSWASRLAVLLPIAAVLSLVYVAALRKMRGKWD